MMTTVDGRSPFAEVSRTKLQNAIAGLDLTPGEWSTVEWLTRMCDAQTVEKMASIIVKSWGRGYLQGMGDTR